MNESYCSGTSRAEVQPLLREGIFLIRQIKHHPCTSSLLTALNAAAYTILTPRPRDVVPPGGTLLSMSYVANAYYVPLLYNMHLFIYFH